MITYCQQRAKEKENREITSEKGDRKACLCGLSSLAENMVIWEFTLVILLLAHSLPKMHSRLGVGGAYIKLAEQNSMMFH